MCRRVGKGIAKPTESLVDCRHLVRPILVAETLSQIKTESADSKKDKVAMYTWFNPNKVEGVLYQSSNSSLGFW